MYHGVGPAAVQDGCWFAVHSRWQVWVFRDALHAGFMRARMCDVVCSSNVTPASDLSVIHRYPNLAGGVAYMNSFGAAGNPPCFVFPLNLGPNSPKAIWEASAHEVGHTAGLLHDGVSGGTTYYQGQGECATLR